MIVPVQLLVLALLAAPLPGPGHEEDPPAGDASAAKAVPGRPAAGAREAPAPPGTGTYRAAGSGREAPSETASGPAVPARPLDADDCARIAVASSGLVHEAEAKVDEWKGRLAEVESTFYPKLWGMGFVAPMFRVRGSPIAPDVERDYGEWGPWMHLEATLAQPLYTFGRAAAGEAAARERIAVERARARQVRNAVALEARRMYYLHLFARSLIPVLENARETLDDALATARREYESGSGKVTRVDLARLEYGSAELDRYRIQARIGADLSLAALKHTMGLPQEAAIELADERLPPPPEAPLPSLAEMLQLAAAERPEWAQIAHGREAALSLEDAERLANAPVVFAAGQLHAAWTPMRPDAANPYAWDPYNRVNAGVAVGLRFDLDPAKASAKAEQARAMARQVDALAAFAATGIPLEVRRAHDDARQAEAIHEVARQGARSARSWLMFAGAAWGAGTGEADELLEGLAAYLQARRTEYESLRDVHTARATLLYATGRAAP